MRWPLISVTEAAVEAWGLQGDADTLLGSSSALRAWITRHLQKLPNLPGPAVRAVTPDEAELACESREGMETDTRREKGMVRA